MNAIPHRRSVLLGALGAAGAAALTACSGSGGHAAPSASSTAPLVSPDGRAVAEAERHRKHGGRTRHVKLTATAGPVDLGGRTVHTWSYDGRVPGREIRLTAGDTLTADLTNHLAAPTSVHWHGIALRNDMDGVPPVTQRAVAPGAAFTYRFTAETPGTYWHHPHVGVQLDRGLYGPLIVEDPREPLSYDAEWVVVLDDWLDGVTGTPDQALAALRKGMGDMHGGGSGNGGHGGGMHGGGHGKSSGDMGGMDMSGSAAGSSPSPSSSAADPMRFMLMGATSKLLGGDAGDVAYPYHLINGRLPSDPDVHRGKPGTRLRLRVINAGGDTAYRLALGGHRMTLTHTDGYPVRHRTADALLLGPGERYDVLVTLKDGVFPLVASAEGKKASGLALLRTGSGRAPRPGVHPRELDGRILHSTDLRADDDVALSARKPDRVHRIELTGSMARYDWALNGRKFDMDHATAAPFRVHDGERVRLEFANRTDMWHPMHLHGHTYRLGTDGRGARKDTVIVLPKQTVTADFDADNPGRWLLHCHNAYHGEVGMMGLVGYTS